MGSKTGNITVYGLPPSTDYQLILETVRPRRTPLHSTIYSTTGLDALSPTLIKPAIQPGTSHVTTSLIAIAVIDCCGHCATNAKQTFMNGTFEVIQLHRGRVKLMFLPVRLLPQSIRLEIQEVAGHGSSPQPVSFNKRPKYPIDKVCIIRTEEPSTSQCKAQQRSDERRNEVIRRNEEFAMHNSIHNQAQEVARSSMPSPSMSTPNHSPPS
ncbi:hypothetical protein EGR_09030 [Echinococcus granulosus]|uniref:Uncharacterized protein n=1 Tax=Echinococcus granulosus TaxID=6210 RepID=W6U6U8_ECHGR|nr:hypothetical protein EGR_09030 [Echinococcus granulosus]EUB56091.1 hypothetical protein EGR_09030 [Echinococcus granulosus]